uniref:Nucleotide-diphospho-sugar transferase domain-containing protein n=2 Tax=Oryza punctata TaxID=4537 RepID=A0A0E0LX80_ORYPU
MPQLFSDDPSCFSPSSGSSSKNMACKVRGDMGKLLPVISFFLGAALTAAFVIATLDVNWRLSALASWNDGAQPAVTDEMKALAELTEVLRNASMEDGTVIMTSINRAYAAPGSLLDLFLESFRLGEGTEPLLKHVLIVAVDPAALVRCRQVHRHCYLLRRPEDAVDYSDEKHFMSKDYLDMMWGRNLFQQTILQLGFNFLFTDIDIMWFRNPLRHIAITSDIAIANDYYNGDPESLRNRPNGGFLYVRAANRTVDFYRRWRDARRRFPPGTNEQYILERTQAELSRRAGVRMQFLDTANCGGFCQLSRDMGRVCTLHANCCTGLANKVHDLAGVLRDWRNYTAAPPAARRRGGFGWTRPGKCIR